MPYTGSQTLTIAASCHAFIYVLTSGSDGLKGRGEGWGQACVFVLVSNKAAALSFGIAHVMSGDSCPVLAAADTAPLYPMHQPIEHSAVPVQQHTGQDKVKRHWHRKGIALS